MRNNHHKKKKVSIKDLTFEKVCSYSRLMNGQMCTAICGNGWRKIATGILYLSAGPRPSAWQMPGDTAASRMSGMIEKGKR